MRKKVLCKYYGRMNDKERIELIDKIMEGKIRFSDPTRFNDPFEFKFRFGTKATKTNIRKRYFLDNPKSGEDEFAEWFTGFSKPNFRWWLERDIRGQLLKGLRVLCLSWNPSNTLMWSHYATNHSGFCILFKPSFLDAFKDNYGPVRYAKDVPMVDYFNDDRSTIVRKMVFHKQLEWKYEREVRIMSVSEENATFRTSAVEGVIAGCRASMKLKERIRQIQVDNPHIKALQAHESSAKYSVDFKTMEPNTFLVSSAF